MTDLFTIPPTPPSELSLARARYAEAQRAYNEDLDSTRGSTRKVHSWLVDDLSSAADTLKEAETRELERLKH
jgi:hypothetical protein